MDHDESKQVLPNPMTASGQTCDWHQNWHMKGNAKGLGDIFIPTWKQAAIEFAQRGRKCTAAVFRWAAGPGPPPPSSVLGTNACAFVPQRCCDYTQPGHRLPCCFLQTQPSEPLVSSNPACAQHRGTTCSCNMLPLQCSSWDQNPSHLHCTLFGQRTEFLANRSWGCRHLGPRDPAQAQPTD